MSSTTLNQDTNQLHLAERYTAAELETIAMTLYETLRRNKKTDGEIILELRAKGLAYENVLKEMHKRTREQEAIIEQQIQVIKQLQPDDEPVKRCAILMNEIQTFLQEDPRHEQIQQAKLDRMSKKYEDVIRREYKF